MEQVKFLFGISVVMAVAMTWVNIHVKNDDQSSDQVSDVHAHMARGSWSRGWIRHGSC